MQSLRNDLKNRGWTIIKSKKINDIKKISNNLLNEIKKNSYLRKLIKKNNVKNIEDMRKIANHLDDNKLNFIIKLYLKNCSFDNSFFANCINKGTT